MRVRARVSHAIYSADPDIGGRIGAYIASAAGSSLSALRRYYAASLFIINVIYKHRDWSLAAFVKLFTVFPSIVLFNLRSQRHIFKLMKRPALSGIAKIQPQFPFKHISEPYLAHGLTPSNRINSLVHNYNFLDENISELFLRDMVNGLIPVYDTVVNDSHYSVVIGLSGPPFKEGEMSLELHLDGFRIFVMSFSFVNSSIIDAGSRSNSILISRMQGGRGCFNLIKAATKDLQDTSPPHILFAALNGVAVALNIDFIFGTSAAKHVCGAKHNAELFQSAYDDFFKSVGATEAVNGFFRFDVPVGNKQIELIKRAHRSRTKKKRRFKSTISEHARLIIQRNCRASHSLSPRDQAKGSEMPSRHELSELSR
ncbi:MAG: DUF535 family protein [Methylocystis sp.]